MIRFCWVCNKLLIVLAFLIINACSTYVPIEIQVLQPANIKISPEIYKVLFINNANYKQNISVIQINNINDDSIESDEYFNGLYNVLSNSPRYEMANANPVYLVKPGFNDRYSSIDFPTLQKLCSDSNADAAIVLEKYELLYTKKIRLQYLADQGCFRGTFEMVNNSLWKIYIPETQKVEDDFLLKDTLYWDGYGANENQIIQQFPSLRDASLQSCFYAGEKYGERIAQTWKQVDRYLINCNNNDFKKAHTLAIQGQWDDAIELWKKFVNRKNKRLASFATYNIAVACETLDHIDLALDWASKSYFIKKSQIVDDYIMLLENRKEQQEVIENQFK